MQFTDIKNKVYFLTKTNSTSFPTADLVILANNAVERVVALINASDSRWQYDDTNQTDLPIATSTITSGQKDYSLATTHLSVDRIEIKDSAGNWTLLKPIDQHDVTGIALAEYKETSGIPEEYDVFGSSVMLYPTPNYTQASSIKVYFTRGPVAFDSGDTTETPGFASIFHDLIPLWISYEYCTANGLPTAVSYFADIQRKEQELKTFYGNRIRAERVRMSTNLKESNK